jgi:predicted nucleic acid-binding protein
MAVVVADTSPLHYLILIGQDALLGRLYREVFVPPAVLEELTHPAAPSVISAWAKKPPAWLRIQAPTMIPEVFKDLGIGERQALALAEQIHADWVLIDDKAARRSAEQQSLKAKGTLGVLADAARSGLINFGHAVESLQRTTMHLDPALVQRIIDEYERGNA